jgi:DNA-binding YbaB/EbfC family protein
VNQDMMARLAKMQEDLQKAQEEIENSVVEATAGGGAVKVEITGAYKVNSLHIDPDAVDPDDLSMLEDLLTAAVNEALGKVQALHSENMGALTGGMGLPPGLGLPGGPAAGGGAGGPQAPMNRAARRANRR